MLEWSDDTALHCVLVPQLLWYLYQGHFTLQSTPTPLIFIATIIPTLQVAVRTSVQGHNLWLFKPGSVQLCWCEDWDVCSCVAIITSLQQSKQSSGPTTTTNPLDNKDSHGSSVSPLPGMVSMVEDSMSLEMRNFVFRLLNRFSYFVAGLRQLRPPPSHIERRRTAAAVKSVLVSSLVLWIEPL